MHDFIECHIAIAVSALKLFDEHALDTRELGHLKEPNRKIRIFRSIEFRPQRADLIPWDLDLEKQTASPRLLEGSGFQFKIPVKPMLGCIGVALLRSSHRSRILTASPSVAVRRVA